MRVLIISLNTFHDKNIFNNLIVFRWSWSSRNAGKLLFWTGAAWRVMITIFLEKSPKFFIAVFLNNMCFWTVSFIVFRDNIIVFLLTLSRLKESRTFSFSAHMKKIMSALAGNSGNSREAHWWDIWFLKLRGASSAREFLFCGFPGLFFHKLMRACWF